MNKALPGSEPTASTQSAAATKCSRRVRNDQNWNSLKDEIYRIYMTEDFTLQNTMRAIVEQHSFKARYNKILDRTYYYTAKT
jgi:hypothetical protein